MSFHCQTKLPFSKAVIISPMRKSTTIILLLVLVLAFFGPLVVADARPAPAPKLSSSSELIDAVNALRDDHGLYPYTPNAILMGIAQTHAEYLAFIEVSNTHIDAYGRRPFQRAIDAGYMVAGDLTLGGWFSENVVGGSGLTAEGAVEIWMGDAPHQNTMLSTVLVDVGAGVEVVGNTYYYVLDCGLSTGGTPVAYTPPPYILVNTPTIVTNTPNPEGAIIHIVQEGDTLLEIAIAYDVSLNELYILNDLNENSVIYPEQQIFVRSAHTATPTYPSPTPTPRSSSTPWPSSTESAPLSSETPTSIQDSGLPSNSVGGSLIAIIIAALVAAAILTFVGSGKKRTKE